MKSPFKPVVRNKRTQDVYFYEGENTFTNIRTGASGKVSDVAAQKTFAISPEISILLNNFPLIADLIRKADLTVEIIN